MKSLRALLIVIVLPTAFCFGQKDLEQTSKSSEFVLGFSVNQPFSVTNQSRRHNLNYIADSYYYDVSNKHTSSILFQLEGEAQFKHAYIRFGLGTQSETSEIEAHNFQVDGHFAFNQSYDSEIVRDLYISEKQHTLIGSLESGYYFFSQEKLFRIGIGAGIDVCYYFSPLETGLNRLDIEEIRDYYIMENEVTLTSSHQKGSNEWSTMIQSVELPRVVPKFTFTSSYRLINHLFLSAQVEMRFISIESIVQKRTTVFEFPVGIGVHYHF